VNGLQIASVTTTTALYNFYFRSTLFTNISGRQSFSAACVSGYRGRWGDASLTGVCKCIRPTDLPQYSHRFMCEVARKIDCRVVKSIRTLLLTPSSSPTDSFWIRHGGLTLIISMCCCLLGNEQYIIWPYFSFSTPRKHASWADAGLSILDLKKNHLSAFCLSHYRQVFASWKSYE